MRTLIKTGIALLIVMGFSACDCSKDKKKEPQHPRRSIVENVVK